MQIRKKEIDQKETNKREKKKGKVWHSRILKKGSYSAVFSVIVIAVIVVLNLIVGQIPTNYTQFDITTGKLYTIGEETKTVLDGLDEDITIYYIVQMGNEDTNLEKLLEQYEAASSRIKVEKKDPVENPAFVRQYTEDSVSENSMIVVGGKRNKLVAYSSCYETEFDYSTYQSQTTGFDGEGQLTGAIAYVISDTMPVLYYVEGHNEISIPETLRERIEKANLELQSLNLLTADSIPENAAALLLNSPEKDYSEAEADKVIAYLKNGGKALILTDYTGNTMEQYDRILQEYGLSVTDGIVVETDSNMYVQRPYYLVPELGASSITNGMTGGSTNILISACRGFRTQEELRDTLEVSAVLSPSTDAFVKTDPQNMTTFDKEQGDAEGPFIVGAAISESVSSTGEAAVDGTEDTSDDSADVNAAADGEKTTQIACFASSSIMDESFNSMVSDGNYTLYMNSITWMVDTEDTTLVSIASKSLAIQYLTITSGQSALCASILCVLLPFACLMIGGVICYRRQHR